METKEGIRFTEEQIANNPAINPQVVIEAERARRILEDLGFWTEEGTKVNNPFDIKTDPKLHGQKRPQLINQSQ